jgi:hypothetical protein
MSRRSGTKAGEERPRLQLSGASDDKSPELGPLSSFLFDFGKEDMSDAQVGSPRSTRNLNPGNF